MTPPEHPVYRVGAVSYLNTVPLVYGMLHGPQRAATKVQFSIPSRCAADVECSTVDIGLVPVAEIARQGLEIVPGPGIAAEGAVRSILLFSKCPWPLVRTVAADAASRTSVELARLILRERFGVTPVIQGSEPDLKRMLHTADAALIIGDPALRLDPAATPYECLDLAEVWFSLTKLPFVFACWAGKPGLPSDALAKLVEGSYRFGRQHLSEIVSAEAPRRGISEALADNYLRRHIRFDLGPREWEGLQTFLRLASLPPVPSSRLTLATEP